MKVLELLCFSSYSSHLSKCFCVKVSPVPYSISTIGKNRIDMPECRTTKYEKVLMQNAKGYQHEGFPSGPPPQY